MGIYISGVKGLPEQVQENKNKIKEVEEQIEGIDFEAIRQLENQVAENTQDINNLEASIGVQNQAINTLNNDVDALESKTQKITYDEDADEIHIASDVIMEEDLEVDNVHVAGNGTFQNANGSGLHFQEGINDDEVCLVNKESGTAHDLTLHADGTLTLDGGPVGGSVSLYEHNIRISRSTSSIRWGVNMTLITTSDTAFSNAGTLNAWLQNHFNDSERIMATGRFGESSNNFSYSSIYAVCFLAGTFSCDVLEFDFTNSIVNTNTKTLNLTASSITITDTVRQIA